MNKHVNKQAHWPLCVDHVIPQEGTKYCHKNPVPVATPSCHHQLCTFFCFVHHPILCILWTFPHLTCYHWCIDLPFAESTLPAWINRSKAQSMLDSPNCWSEPLYLLNAATTKENLCWFDELASSLRAKLCAVKTILDIFWWHCVGRNVLDVI